MDAGDWTLVESALAFSWSQASCVHMHPGCHIHKSCWPSPPAHLHRASSLLPHTTSQRSLPVTRPGRHSPLTHPPPKHYCARASDAASSPPGVATPWSRPQSLMYTQSCAFPPLVLSEKHVPSRSFCLLPSVGRAAAAAACCCSNTHDPGAAVAATVTAAAVTVAAVTAAAVTAAAACAATTCLRPTPPHVSHPGRALSAAGCLARA